VSFTWRDVSLERNEALSSAMVVRGTAPFSRIHVRLEDRKLALAVCLARGSSPLCGLKEPVVLDLG
jgi:hypothetical protein